MNLGNPLFNSQTSCGYSVHYIWQVRRLTSPLLSNVTSSWSNRFSRDKVSFSNLFKTDNRKLISHISPLPEIFVALEFYKTVYTIFTLRIVCTVAWEIDPEIYRLADFRGQCWKPGFIDGVESSFNLGITAPDLSWTEPLSLSFFTHLCFKPLN